MPSLTFLKMLLGK
ncbi:Protein of unknown function [Lactobacillus delbrueckii subsp. lactis]|nr:Protein of unknown function [Lactobacillus delbrueckii subsp. lactis]